MADSKDTVSEVGGNIDPNLKKKTSKCFVFTDYEVSNDYKEWDDIKTYIVFGLETCPKTQKKHNQGYVSLNKSMRYTQLKKLLPKGDKIWFGLAKATDMANKNYCSKDGNFVERGKPKGRQGQRNDLLSATKEASMAEVREKHPTIYAKYNKGLTAYFNSNPKCRRSDPTKCMVYWGIAGKGKSRKAWEAYPDAYSKANNKWWDHYQNDKVVIWDDFTHNIISKEEFCKLIDRYPTYVETKGGTTNFNSALVIITTNEDCANDPWWNTPEVKRRCEFQEFK